MCASRLHVTFYSGYMKAKSDNRITNLNKTAPKVFERSTNVTLNLMFVVYVVASCVRLIGRRSSGWSVISTSSLFFLSLRFFCCWHCCREKRPPSSFWDWAAEGKKKKKLRCPGARIRSERVTQNTQKTAKKLWHIDRQATVKWPAVGIQKSLFNNVVCWDEYNHAGWRSWAVVCMRIPPPLRLIYLHPSNATQMYV